MIGVNLAGAEFATNAVYPTTSEIDYFASKGMGVIRLPFKWERLQPTQNGPLDPAELAQIKAVVDYAGSKGVNVVLDVHNFGSGYGNVIGSAATPDAAFADLWGKLATTFKDSPQVLFGLMNEPNSQTSSQWIVSANAAIAAIRDAGAGQRILVPGAYYSGAQDWVSSDNDTVVGAGVVDPLNNYSFEVHQYLDANNSGTSRTVASEDVGVKRLAAVTQWAIDTGHTLFLGEFGVSNDPTAVVALDRMLQFMEQNAAVWVGATYWAAGPSWGDYMYSVEPDNLANPVDKVQLDVLEKYDLDPSTPVPDISPPPPPPDGIAMTRAIDAPSVINEGEAMQLTFSVRNAVAGQTFDFWQQSAMDADDFEHSLADDFAAALPAGATYTEVTPLRGTITLAPGTYSFTLSRQTRIDGVVELIDKASWAEGNQENTDIRIGSFTGGLKLVSESAITNWVTDRPYADPSPPSPTPGSVSGTAGADVLNGTAGADALYGLAGNDTLNGLGGNDRLVGGSGNDRLDGGAAADEMWGEAGNDTYSVDDPGDQVYEGFGGGTDTVQSTISYHLGDNVENLLLRTGASIDGTGNAFKNRIEGNSGNNRLVGNAGDDTLLGGGGNDILIGGIGQDVLTGGAGSDLFVFDVPHDTAADQITDFAPGIDRVGIDSVAFGLGIGFGMAGGGSLDPDWFAAGGSATAEHGQFIFDAPSATLFWDADGLGPDRPAALAVFKPGVVLQLADLTVLGEGVSRDVTRPTAAAAVSDLTSPAPAHQVEVTYADTGTGVDLTSIGVEDLLISGPTNVAVEAVSIATNFDGSVTATYRLGSADGFNDADNGAYTIALAADAVTDHAGNGVGGAPSLASFAVNIAPPWSAGGIVAAVNAGGVGYVSGATIYAPDTASSPNTSLIGPAKITSFTSPIAGTDDDSLYQTYRYGKSFGYDIAGLAAGDYLVELSFAESYWTAPGKRVFDVLAEGQEIVSDLDIFAASGGKNVALDMSRVVTVTDGTLNLRFDASGADDRDNALVGSFVIRKVSGAADTAPPQASAQVADVTVAATAADVIVTYTDAGSGLALGTIGTDDLLVTGPGNVSVESVSVQVQGNGTVAATYRLGSPGGFTAADNGQHLITLVPGSVRDQAGNAVDHAVDLGSFAVSIEASQINEITGTDVADTLNGTAAADHIDGLGGNDVLNGLGGDDILDGGAGNDKLNGNAGADLMRGGAGNDTYFVDHAGDVLVEEAGGGTDTVNSDISFQLGAEIENLILRTGASLNGTGNASDNRLEGNSGANILSGLGGNDVLFGKGGSDMLTGGAGSDQFVFDTAPGAGNVDIVTDFESGTDKIVLENAVFQALGANGALSATMFEIGAFATRPDTHVLFDPITGVISYDADGSGAGAAVAFALLPFGTMVNASDFLII